MDSKIEAIRKVACYMKEAEKRIAKGERVLEIADATKSFISEIDNLMEGTSGNPLIDMLTFMDGKRQIPLKGKTDKLTLSLEDIKIELASLKEKAELDSYKCSHNWVVEKLGADIGGYWIDAHCTLCKSSITLHPYGICKEAFGDIAKFPDNLKKMQEEQWKNKVRVTPEPTLWSILFEKKK